MKVLVYLTTLSRFSMAKDRSGMFRNVQVKVGGEHFSGLLYKGRPLTVEEFNAEFEAILYPRVPGLYGGARVMVKVVDEQELSDEAFDFDEVEDEKPNAPEPAAKPEEDAGEPDAGEGEETTGETDSGDPFVDQGADLVRGKLEELTKGEIAEKVYADKGVAISTGQNKSAVIDEALAVYFPSSDKGGEVK